MKIGFSFYWLCGYLAMTFVFAANSVGTIGVIDWGDVFGTMLIVLTAAGISFMAGRESNE